MKNKLYKDKKKRHLSLSKEIKKDILFSIYKNQRVPSNVRWNSGLEFSQNFFSNNIRSSVNRCVFTGRKKQIHKNFKLSRLSFLKFARNGLINGLVKSSW